MLQLRPDLSFCFVGERAVMLDLEADRYFLLEGDTLRAIRMATTGDHEFEQGMRLPTLGNRPMFVEGSAPVAPIAATMPLRSALEAGAKRARGFGVGELAVAQYRTHLSLRFRGLRSTIVRWRAARPTVPARSDFDLALSLAQYYAAKRALVPLRRSCVPDSLALMRMFWRHGLDADLLFGVRLDPFAAHCWVQSDDHLLSDPLSNIADFTPVFRL